MASSTGAPESKAHSWGLLVLAGIFEIGYALSVGASQGFTVWLWSAAACVLFLLTLYFLSVALRVFDVGIGYAVWAGLGSVGSACLGSLLLNQPLTFIKAFWLLVIVVGVIWLKLADSAKLKS